jgi:soluble lytic murein transglycosylase-like protein
MIFFVAIAKMSAPQLDNQQFHAERKTVQLDKAERPAGHKKIKQEKTRPKSKKKVKPAGKVELMALAGIPKEEQAAVDYIVHKESSWNHRAVNISSGATGLCQSLPANKMASAGDDYLTNPVTQLKWCHKYARSRYGGWWKAFAFWRINSWW